MLTVSIRKVLNYPNVTFVVDTIQEAMNIANRQRKANCDSVEIRDEHQNLIYRKEINLKGEWDVLEDRRLPWQK